MSDLLPSLTSLTGAALLPPPRKTGIERIFAAYQQEGGAGLKALSKEDKLLHQQLESAYALLLNYKTFESAWPLLAGAYDISRATAYRRLREAQNLFGDVKKVKKEGRRSVLIEKANQIANLCMLLNPPDYRGALAAMKFEASLAGLLRVDAHGEESAAEVGNTSYVLNLTVEGRKPRQFDLTRPQDITDVDFEQVLEAVSQNVVDGDEMAQLIRESKEGNGKL
ncbi:hypothetical protein GO988_15500 [Hymenobacter sp. HMF4947]|uniref:Uncharacterized protein n=1 Tax=Hymenobacter ginkgonis TaxID=2682976 RepID=A0A7K1TH61_9BACT|nr:hypothetical protein [Hymenobacter ginkgonis]MVN77738.1 hypothetical protein [Hymenobacter ginkgonis]